MPHTKGFLQKAETSTIQNQQCPVVFSGDGKKSLLGPGNIASESVRREGVEFIWTDRLWVWTVKYSLSNQQILSIIIRRQFQVLHSRYFFQFIKSSRLFLMNPGSFYRTRLYCRRGNTRNVSIVVIENPPNYENVSSIALHSKSC
jgi:hypothetical protein